MIWGPELGSRLLIPVLMDSLMGMCEWVSDSRESAWLANPSELRIRVTGLPYSWIVHTRTKRLYGRTISHNIKKACELLSELRESVSFANPCELRIRLTVLYLVL